MSYLYPRLVVLIWRKIFARKTKYFPQPKSAWLFVQIQVVSDYAANINTGIAQYLNPNHRLKTLYSILNKIIGASTICVGASLFTSGNRTALFNPCGQSIRVCANIEESNIDGLMK